MNVAPPCPPRDRLERLVLGFLPADEANETEEHVLACPRCGVVLGSVTATDPLIRAMRSGDAAAIGEAQRRAEAYIPHFKRLVSHDATTGWDGVAAPEHGFLAPPQADDGRGRLGPYVVRGTLGSGGMGVVYLGEDPRLRRPVALKVIRPEMLGREEAKQRFIAEARAVAAVEHDHIVTIYEVNEVDGVPFIAMPVLRGESLEDRLRRVEGPMPVGEVLRIGREMASGLAAAHARGLIHRDIKPANVFLEGEGSRVKLLDFGLAQPVGDAAGGGTVVGTPAYMAPEQARCLPLDARADLFALGCVMYRMATGRPPFRAPDLVALLMQIVCEEPAPIRDLPPEVAGLIARLMRKQPADRPASSAEVVEAIAGIERKRAAPGRWWVAAVVALLALAVGLTAWMRPGVKPVPPATVTFRLDEPGHQGILAEGGEGEIELAAGRAHSLVPGAYLLRPATKTPRELWPARIALAPGEEREIELRLVGEVRADEGQGGVLYDVACAGRGKALLALSAGSDATVGAWRPNTDERSGSFSGTEHRQPVRAVSLSADGKRAASGGGGRGTPADHTIRLWGVEGRMVTGRLVGHGDTVTSLALSPGGDRLLSGDGEGVVLLWDVATKARLASFAGHDRRGVHAVALSAVGKLALSAGGDNRVILWDIAAKKERDRHADHTDEARAVAFSPSGSMAASGGGDGKIVLWDLATGLRRTIDAHEGGVFRVAFSPDGRRLASGGADGAVRLWDVAEATQVVALPGHRGAVHAVTFAEGGRRVVSGGADRTLRLWELPP